MDIINARTAAGLCRRCSWVLNRLGDAAAKGLEEEPTRHAVLGDITCDSDGKVDAFIDRRDVKRTLPLDTFDGGDYYLGAFLLGAYQEILGDLHHLFGDTNAVHVRLGPAGDVPLDSVTRSAPPGTGTLGNLRQGPQRGVDRRRIWKQVGNLGVNVVGSDALTKRLSIRPAFRSTILTCENCCLFAC